MPINPLNVPYPDFKIHEVIDPEQFDLNNQRIVDKINEVITEHESTKGNFQTQIDTNESESIARDDALDTKINTKEAEAIARNTTTNNLIATRASESVTRDNNLQSQITANVTQLSQQRLNWLPFVNTIALRDAIPNPKNADAVFVRDTNRLYRHNGSAWIAIQDASMTVVNEVDLRLSARLDKLELDVTTFGAVGDGVTDDSEAIQSAIEALALVGGTLRFPEGKTFLLGDGIMDAVNGTGTTYPKGVGNDPDLTSDPARGRDIRLRFVGYKDVTIIGYGATLLSHPNNGETMHNSILDFEDCDGVTILGLTVDGNKNARQPSVSDYDDGRGWNDRSNISFSGCDNIHIEGVKSLNSMMDGIAIGGNEGVPDKFIHIKNTVCDNAYRNGLTLSTVQFARLENCSFTNTGKTYGTAPKIGADVEADWAGTSNENVVFVNCYFEGNVIAGLAFAQGSVSNHVERCVFNGANQGPAFGFVNTVWGYNYVDSCHFINCGIPTNAEGVYFKNNIFEANPVVATGQTGAFSFMHLQGTDEEKEAATYIEDNIFLVNLDNVAVDSGELDLGRFWIMDRTNVYVRGNTFINFLPTSGSGQYLIRVGNGGSFFQDNTLVFDIDDYPALQARIYSPYVFQGPYDMYPQDLNRIKDNKFINYPEDLIQTLNPTEYLSSVDGPIYQKSVVLGANSVTKISPALVGGFVTFMNYEVVLEFFYGPSKATYRNVSSWAFGSELVVEKAGKFTTDYSDLNFDLYEDGDDFYVDLTGYYTICRATLIFTTNQNVSTINPDKNIFVEATSADIVGLTAVTPKCKVKLVPNVAALAGLSFDTGHSVFVYDINKPLWWDDTNWVDSAGTIVV